MMVVIGIIAILGAVVVPGFKKIYGDFRIKKTCWMIDVVLSAERSFYLIFNEGPKILSSNHADKRTVSVFPSGWIDTRPSTTAYGGKPAGYYYRGISATYSKGAYLFVTLAGCGSKDVMIDCNKKPYYYDDLMDRYERMGYRVNRLGNASSGWSYILSPYYIRL